MSDPSTSAMDNHLQRYDTSDADSGTHTTGGGVDSEETSFWGIVFSETSHPSPDNVRVRHKKGGVLFLYLYSRHVDNLSGVMAL